MLRRMTKAIGDGLARLAAMAVGGLSVFALMALLTAQTPSIPGPYNTDLGAVITNTLREAGTTTSSLQTNLASLGVRCRFVQTAASGSPSTTFSIQTYDAATASYITQATSGAITSSTPAEVLIYPGAVLTTTPTGTVLESVPLGRSWRVSQTVGGTAGPATTSKIGCNYLK